MTRLYPYNKLPITTIAEVKNIASQLENLDPENKDAYEANAKRLITSWGGIQEDYAARFWSGLIKDYYIPRIQLYFTKDRNKIREWEEQWITSPWSNSTTPFDDPVEAALSLIEKTNK